MARRRSIYDTGNYSTPLADFLEEIPNYFLRFEQLKQAEADRADQKAFRNQQYRDEIEQQRKNNIYRQEQADNQERNRLFDNHTKLMQGMSSLQQTQYIDNVIKKDPNLKGYMDFSEFESFSKNIQDANTEYDDINADVDDFRGSSLMSMFPRYQDVANTYQELQNMEKSVRGTDLELGHAKDLKYVADLKKQLETLSGREMAEKDMPPTLQKQFNSLTKTNDADYKAMVESQDELAQYAVLSPQGEWVQRQPSEGEMESSIKMGFSKAKLSYDNSLNRFQASKIQRNNFTKQQGLFYPNITTAKQQEELDAQSEARTSWFNENESYINSNPETAKLALDYLTDPTNADRFSALQKAVVDNKGYDEFEAQTDAEIAALDDEIEPYVEGAKEPATEFEPGADITGEDVDDVLADVRETTGFYPEGDAPREPETTPKRDIDINLPSVAEPLTARSNRETESIIARKEKESAETPLFKEPVKIEDLKSMDINDSKGSPITFESTKEFDKQINSMYSEIKNIGKKLTQSGSSREQRVEMKESQKRISKDLIKTLDILNISNADASVKDKNLKSTMNQFLKNKKFRDSDALINFLQKYI